MDDLLDLEDEEDRDAFDDAVEEVGTDRFWFWFSLEEGRRMNPNSWYISWVSREDAAEEGMKRLKEGVDEAVVGKKEYEEVAEYDMRVVVEVVKGLLTQERATSQSAFATGDAGESGHAAGALYTRAHATMRHANSGRLNQSRMEQNCQLGQVFDTIAHGMRAKYCRQGDGRVRRIGLTHEQCSALFSLLT
ncbi:hypothetical protein NLJ89_g1749 [Agrocybe chaxingu]|uniref:Uncharacterized protein n=1 Tax=Agrocybe chaxingu TaxID=84603 RepID=A0A9W8MZG0_9AGAR|nr:hypothetical protein NLJ89_g1749 [Agrocybe chaxingu]